ncbi:MAG: Sir2 family NAD-dependent protein deacetylase [Kineosporiaceae bacterium]
MIRKRIVALTGAGISAPSGLPTYRGVGSDPALTHPTALADFEARPEEVWQYFGGLRTAARAAAPNPAHDALADLGFTHDVTIATQNVDTLHEEAGSRIVHHLHGNLFRTRCHDPFCALPPADDHSAPDRPPTCPRCGSLLRPDVVLFGEPLPRPAKRATDAAVADADLLLVIGTTLAVNTASTVTRWARDCGVPRVWLTRDPDPAAYDLFQRVIDADAVEALPPLLDDVEALIGQLARR